jgi:hypothetical protein
MMMKRIFTTQFMGALLIISISARAQDSLFISEVTDPADDFAGRFIELFNAGGEPVDLNATTFYLSRQSNGGTSWGDLLLTGTVQPGATFVIGGSGFEALYGFAPDQESGILIGNGDDAYCLFREGDHETGVLHDIYGVIDMDGTGEPWEYEDSRAFRVEQIATPNTAWSAAEWVIAPANVADCDPGTHNGSVINDTITPGDFSLVLISDTVPPGQPVEVPVRVSELTAADNIISYQMDIEFDPLALEYTGETLEGTLAEGGTVVVNSSVAGRLSLGYMNTTALTGAGSILRLQFQSLVPDTTDLFLTHAYLNTIPVPDAHGTVIISETAPPTAVISYSDSVIRFADTLIITATFSEPMDPSNPVLIDLTGAVTLTDGEMTRLSETIYRYPFLVPKTGGEVTVGLGNGTDLWGNELVPVPISGATFFIIAFNPGDVNDDGAIQAYDAALALQYSVGIDPIPLEDPLPWENWRDSTANVDGLGGITANDAGMILQFSAGIISGFPNGVMVPLSAPDVTVEVLDRHLLFYSHGELLGLNIDATSEKGMLGTPEILKEGFLSAINMDGNHYRIGLCTASSLEDGDAFLKIPFNGSGAVTFRMIMNTEEKEVTVDLATGLNEPVKGGIEIYPNPVTDILKIGGLIRPAVAEIYNIHGQLLVAAQTDGPFGEIDLSALPAGLYMISLETDGETLVKRFIKR